MTQGMVGQEDVDVRQVALWKNCQIWNEDLIIGWSRLRCWTYKPRAGELPPKLGRCEAPPSSAYSCPLYKAG